MNITLPKELTFCPYAVLDLDPKSHPTDKSITKAYKLMALRTHPDKNPSAEARAKFEQVKLASQVLLNEELRKAYDKVLEARWLQEERMKRQGLDRQKVVEELL
jgi:DnaJ-class molecular chaperone